MYLYKYIIKCRTCGSSYNLLLDIQDEEKFNIADYERCIKCPDDKEDAYSELISKDYIVERVKWGKPFSSMCNTPWEDVEITDEKKT